MNVECIVIDGVEYMCRLESGIHKCKSKRVQNAQIIKDFIELYKSGGMRTVVKIDKLAMTETTLFKQFMEAVATELCSE